MVFLTHILNRGGSVRVRRLLPSGSVLFAAVLAILALFCLPGRSQAQTEGRLARITKMSIGVEDLGDDELAAGIDADRLRALTQQKLSQVGIRVLSEEEDATDGQTTPYIYIRLIIIPIANGAGYAVSYDVSLRVITMSPVSFAYVPAILWSRSGIGTVPKEKTPQFAEEVVGMQINAFLKDYLRDNEAE